MITETTYIRPNITIEHELVGSKMYFVYNFKGISYRVFNSLTTLNNYISGVTEACLFECNSEKELEKYFNA
jgi:hypothetical protein